VRTRKGLQWTPVAIAGILRNRAYAGVYSRYGTLIGGSHTPIVERALFNAVQARLQARRPATSTRSPAPFSLSGLVRCGLCGQGVFGLTRRRAWTLQDGTQRSQVYRYYECRARAYAHRESPDGSAHPSWRAERLEQAVLSALGAGLPHPQAGTGVTEARASGRPSPPDGTRAASRRGKRGLALAEREFVRTLRQIAAGRARMSDLDTALGALRAARSGAAQAPASPEASEGQPPARIPGEISASAIEARVERIILYSDRVQVVRRAE
jgi:hypothetical protein